MRRVLATWHFHDSFKNQMGGDQNLDFVRSWTCFVNFSPENENNVNNKTY